MLGIKTALLKNKFCLNGKRVEKRNVNLEWWSESENLGDYLATVIYSWMLRQQHLNENAITKKTYHLLTIGSIIGMGNFDAVVWGSGIHTKETMANVFQRKKSRKYDIRLVRGPITRTILLSAGYACPKNYGDPAILMPKIYNLNVKKKYKVSVIEHISTKNSPKKSNINYINIATKDYKKFIKEIKESEYIISSSLHGIILAESYGVPAIFLAKDMDNEKMKFYDWYLSTGRTEIKYASSLDEALSMTPMQLPLKLAEMQKNVFESFPYDLWN